MSIFEFDIEKIRLAAAAKNYNLNDKMKAYRSSHTFGNMLVK